VKTAEGKLYLFVAIDRTSKFAVVVEPVHDRARIQAETLHRFWQMLGQNQGQMLNAAQLAAGLGSAARRSPDISTSWLTSCLCVVCSRGLPMSAGRCR
jgi:hypothetical protein